ncbi:helix-turn-helix domain-containing protein [Gordonia sp. ABSL11-1]|uniref:TetR/AcrR family transcriptional regulator n=1 Tax=Gordonia sp. ABSL11-1 TaxID=3053924 RepID=UPI0025726DD8|nr:TetR/AcrR family transcriptional regulator [Gordonia sp. ABSL11-1]MDL9948539.1 helix-turn-helix domain-containing protein [Gordonia sp. ABSL11-1]
MSEASTDQRPTTGISARLLDATEKLLADKGIRATTMQEVAETAGVSRAWLYRHFPDKSTLIGAAIVRLNEAFWNDARDELEAIDGFDRQIAAGVRIGRGAYDDPGTLLLRLRTEEPDEFAACAGMGVTGLVPDLALFWRPYIDAAAARGEIHPGHDLDEVAEWVARVLISLGTVPSETIDPDDIDALLRHIRRYLMPALRAEP